MEAGGAGGVRVRAPGSAARRVPFGGEEGGAGRGGGEKQRPLSSLVQLDASLLSAWMGRREELLPGEPGRQPAFSSS